MPTVKTYPAKELKNKTGSVLSVANPEPVGITRNGHFSYVILSAQDWENRHEKQLRQSNTKALKQPLINKDHKEKNAGKTSMLLACGQIEKRSKTLLLISEI